MTSVIKKPEPIIFSLGYYLSVEVKTDPYTMIAIVNNESVGHIRKLTMNPKVSYEVQLLLGNKLDIILPVTDLLFSNASINNQDIKVFIWVTGRGDILFEDWMFSWGSVDIDKYINRKV